MPRDDDQMVRGLSPEFGSGVIGVCDVCGKRQAVIVLQKERFKLCVLDFLNKTWSQPGLKPGAPLPPYKSDRVWFPTEAVKEGKAAAVVLSPTKLVKHPVALVTPDIYGLTTSVLDLGIRLAREGCEVLLPDLSRIPGVGPRDHATLRMGARFRGGVALDQPRIAHLRTLFRDGLRYLRGREMVDPDKTVVAGLSYGAALATAVAVEDRSVSALVLAYPVPVQPVDYLKLVNAPVLFVDAGADPGSRAARAQWEPLAASGAVSVRFVDQPSARGNFLARDLRAYQLTEAEAAWSEVSGFVRARLFPPPPKAPVPPVRLAAPSTPPGSGASPTGVASPSAVARTAPGTAPKSPG